MRRIPALLLRAVRNSHIAPEYGALQSLRALVCQSVFSFTNAFRKIIAKMTDFHLYYSARRRIFEIVARRAEDRRGLPAVTEKL